MSLVVSLLLGVALPLSLAYAFGPNKLSKRPLDPSALPSALLHTYTSHARFLPKPARHAFSYPLLYLGVDIDALEAAQLDLPGRVITYGGRPATKFLGLRSDNYLEAGQAGLRAKVEMLLKQYEIASEEIGRVWLVTMPSFLGFEGINPLSVWYIYSQDKQLCCVILEVHNTFGEK